MGLGSSRPTSGIPGVMQFAPVTREQLLKNSAIPRLMINDIFNAMITKITPVDILDLANSNKCSTYVFAMAETLDSLFKGLKIQPRQDKTSGVIIFQKLDELKKQSDKSESRTLCLTLAYYYIRIFQIFGALALTVVDDPGSMEVLGAIQRVPLKQQVIPGRQFQPAFIGGAGGASEKLGKYLHLLYLQSSDSDIPQPLKNKDYNIYLIDHNEEGDNRKIFYFIKKNKEKQQINLLREYDYYYLRAKVTINDEYYSSIGDSTSNGKAIFTMENYNIQFKFDIDKRLNDTINKEINKKRDYKLVKDGGDWYVLDDDGKKHIFKNAIPYLFNKKDKQIKEIYNKLTTKKQQDGTRDRGYAQQQYIQQSTPFETSALSTEYIRKTLESFKSTSRSSESKALSFCTARALQLLDATKIQRPTQTTPRSGLSGICLPSLPAAPLSTPQPGTRLDKVPGLHALEQLYHTNYSIKEGKFQVDTPTTDQEYAKFLQSISDLFGKPQQKAVSKFQDIPAADPPARCADAVKKYLQISNPKTIDEVLTIINRMFGRQLAHTKNVIEFMRKYLINIKTINVAGAKQTVFLLNPRILQNGIAEVNQVGKMARQLLLNYYTDCETAYKQGIDIISKSTDVKAVQV
jgi:hypothetical protein